MSDGEALSLELSGQLLAPPGLTATIEQHLLVIREAEPFLTVVHPRLDWVPGDLVIVLTAQAFDQFLAGTYTGLDDLNAVYGPVEIGPVYEFLNGFVMDFEADYNPDILTPIYSEAPGVIIAESNSVGGDGPDITAETLGSYLFKYGWFDCMVGCAYNHFWRYQVVLGGQPILIDEWGDPIPAVDVPNIPGAPELEVHSIVPNPLTTTSRISYSVSRSSNVSLEILDVSGRQVRTLERSLIDPGSHEVWWDATNDRGERVSSGTYFVVLRVESAAAQIRKLTVIR